MNTDLILAAVGTGYLLYETTRLVRTVWRNHLANQEVRALVRLERDRRRARTALARRRKGK